MIFSENLILKSHCSFKERKEFTNLIATIVDLSEIAYKKGIIYLELEGILDKLENRFLANALQLLADGTIPEIVEEILLSLVLTDKLEGKALLEKLLIITGVVAIQFRNSPIIVETRLMSLMGIDLFENWVVKYFGVL